jgi:hypothetical protein
MDGNGHGGPRSCWKRLKLSRSRYAMWRHPRSKYGANRSRAYVVRPIGGEMTIAKLGKTSSLDGVLASRESEGTGHAEALSEKLRDRSRKGVRKKWGADFSDNSVRRRRRGCHWPTLSNTTLTLCPTLVL